MTPKMERKHNFQLTKEEHVSFRLFKTVTFQGLGHLVAKFG